jgi:hypothetical protein
MGKISNTGPSALNKEIEKVLKGGKKRGISPETVALIEKELRLV